MSAPPLATAICIVGPTASGKSALALALAQIIPAEIISVDSALVYRGMDIGTAKPTASERAAAAHHLIDIRDPCTTYSAAEFVRDAQQLMADIRARGRLPLLVGGTMLYFKALLEGLSDIPAANPQLRQILEARGLAEGWPALHAELAHIDPATAARLAPADSQRIQRALEVWHLTGRPLSAFHSDRRARPESSALPVFSLEPLQRTWLHTRIAQRFDAMLADGFIREVQALRARGDLTPELSSMRCVGYRQAWQALDAAAPASHLSSVQLAALREKGIAATRQLAKRQLTWLRSMPGRHILPIDDKVWPEALAQQLLSRISTDTF